MLNLATEPFSSFINIPARLDTFWKFSIYHSFSMFLLSIPSAWNLHCHFTTQRGCILSPLLSRFIRRCKQPAALKRNTRFREKLPFILPRIEKNTYALKSHEHFWKRQGCIGNFGKKRGDKGGTQHSESWNSNLLRGKKRILPSKWERYLWDSFGSFGVIGICSNSILHLQHNQYRNDVVSQQETNRTLC